MQEKLLNLRMRLKFSILHCKSSMIMEWEADKGTVIIKFLDTKMLEKKEKLVWEASV